jgi:3-hydroxyisobutyrate dehydrogenase
MEPVTHARIAFLGTGLMGAPMARRLLVSGHTVTVWNRTPDKARRLAADGATPSPDPATAIRDADGIVAMLTDASAIRQTLLAEETRPLLPGRTLLQAGTIGPRESEALSREIRDLGGRYLEAPVLGSIPEASEGRLIVMVGSDQDVFERWLPVLRCFGPDPRRIGDVGSAAALKLALNQLIATITTAYAQSLGMIRRSGVDVELYAEIVRSSALCAPTFDKKLPRMLERRFLPANFPARHLLKDIRLFLDEAERLGLFTPAVSGVSEILERTLGAGFGDADYSSLSAAVDPPRPEPEPVDVAGSDSE